jgi:hypothetical protein
VFTSEIFCLVSILSLLIADKIAGGQKYWNHIIVFQKIIELLHAKKFYQLLYKALETLIGNYLKLSKKLSEGNLQSW